MTKSNLNANIHSKNKRIFKLFKPFYIIEYIFNKKTHPCSLTRL